MRLGLDYGCLSYRLGIAVRTGAKWLWKRELDRIGAGEQLVGKTSLTSESCPGRFCSMEAAVFSEPSS